MTEDISIKLSKEIIEALSVHDIIYVELAEGGAMGNDRGIMFYCLEDQKLKKYETSLFDEENLYSEMQLIILEHQDKLEINNATIRKLVFDYFYGGMGNHVFVNKGIQLEKSENFFNFKNGIENYKIYPTVQGVFDSVSKSFYNK